MSLDVGVPQIIVNYPDNRLPWHHRILLVDLGGGKWIWATPDRSVQVGDLTSLSFKTVVRNADFPPVTGNIYGFDPLTDQEILQLKSEAQLMASVMGVNTAAPNAVIDAVWLYADVAYEGFNTELSAAVMGNPLRMVIRGAAALAQPAEGVWTYAECVMTADRNGWLQEKRSGVGRDPRLGPTCVRPDGTPCALLKNQLPKLVSQAMTSFPFSGPPATPEVLTGIVSSGHEPIAYHSEWVRTSGVNGQAGIAVEHSVICTTLSLAIGYDTLNVLNLAFFEQMCRRLLMIERAVKRNPRAPDFEGLEMFLANGFDATGGVTTRDFDKYIAETQRNDAVIMKQSRLWREEHHADVKSKKETKGKGKDKGE